MGASFQPSVVPDRGLTFGDTFSRALEGAFGFVTDVNEQRRRGAEFESAQRNAKLRNEALEQELGIRGRQATLDIIRDPTQVTGGERKRIEAGGAEAGRGDQAAAPPTGPTPRSPELEAALEAARGSAGGGLPPAPGEEQAAAPPGGGFAPPPFIAQPDQVFAPGGEAMRIADLGVEAPAIGQPATAAPTVPDALADELAPGQPKIPRRPQLQQIGADPQLGEIFFDPQGAERQAIESASFVGEEIRDILERSAQQAEQGGQGDVAEGIRSRIATAVAQVEAGVPPNDVVQEVFADAETGRERQGREQFLTQDITQRGGQVPAAAQLDLLTPEGRIEELDMLRDNMIAQADRLEQQAMLAEQSGQVEQAERFRAQMINTVLSNFQTQTRVMSDRATGLAGMQASFEGVQAGNPAAGLALIIGYNKVLDPPSIVRQGEVQTTTRLASLPERVQRAFQQAQTGTPVTVAMAENLLAAARGIVGANVATFSEFRDAALLRAEAVGLDRAEMEGLLPNPFAQFDFEEEGTAQELEEEARRLEAEGTMEERAEFVRGLNTNRFGGR